jgi:predicted membrane chloride channel (bestrophin family)|tara:strand:- start:1096 stop:1773 length:678 start_codon:yes stop_codon:yes gene_type:complete
MPLLAYHFEVIANIDLTLLSIAIIFPLVFTIRGAFRRREKALEHLSRFRASLKTVINILNSSIKVPQEEKDQASEILHAVNENLFNHLKTKEENFISFDRKVEEFYTFIETKSAIIGNGTREKSLRFFKDTIESADNLIAIHSHRTPVSLKAYCLIFIYIFPIIYTPTIINKIGYDNPSWLTFFIVILSEFILISLYNIQDQMEYPFDDEGLDDIKFNIFRVDRK